MTYCILGTGLLFHGQVYGNNSILSVSDIGERRKALICITNKINCCRREDKHDIEPGEGEWYFPDGSKVLVKDGGADFYRDRHASTIRLNRRNDATMPSGLFRCEVNDSYNVTKNLYVGIYTLSSENTGIMTYFTCNKLLYYLLYYNIQVNPALHH